MRIEISGRSLKAGLRSVFCEKRMIEDPVNHKREVEYHFTLRKVLKTFLAVWGVLGFSLFMLEEGFQTTMFSTWPLQDVGRYDVIEKRIPVLQGINMTGRVINYALGWTCPPFWFAYNCYFGPGKAGDAYIDSLRQLVAANGGQNLEAVAPATTLPAVAPTPQPLPVVANFTDKPVFPGAIDCTETGALIGFTRTVVVPVTSIRHLVTKKGGPMAIAKSPTNFTLVAWDQSVCDRMDELREKWVVVSGELVLYEGTVEIILNSWSQVLQTSELLVASK